MYNKIVAMLVISAAFCGCATPNQARFDAEVDRLCAIDGGVRVYETVQLPPAQFRKDGIPVFFNLQTGESALGPEYKVQRATTVIAGAVDGFKGTSLIRNSFEVYRRDTGQLMGVEVTYIRTGGDLPIVDHPSSHRCPRTHKSVVESIFLKHNP